MTLKIHGCVILKIDGGWLNCIKMPEGKDCARNMKSCEKLPTYCFAVLVNNCSSKSNIDTCGLLLNSMARCSPTAKHQWSAQTISLF